MKACLHYCRGKNFENEQWWQQVFKDQYLDLGCWPSFGAPASTPQQQESKLLSLLSSEPRSTCGVGSGVSQCGCATPESTFRRLRCTQRVSALFLSQHRDISLGSFHAAHKALCTKEHPCFRTKMFPSCICRQEAADLGQPPLHLQVKSTEMAETHLPLSLSSSSPKQGYLLSPASAVLRYFKICGYQHYIGKQQGLSHYFFIP